jgi:hypothetical protein
MAEQPALNRFYVASYAANDKDFPILAVRLDPRVAGYRVPEDLSPHPDSKRYPNHVFTGSQPSNGDERVTHVYEILPSPYVPFTRYDDDLGPIQGRRRSVKNEGQVAVLAADKRVTYEAREGSAIVYTEIEEEWSIKTDEDGNSLFPIKDRDFYDPSRGAVQERRQLFVPTGEEEGTLENVNGVITQTSYEPYNEFLSVKIVQTYKVDGPQLIGKATDNDGQLVTITTQRKGSDGYIPPNPTATRTVEVSREDAESLVERIVDTPEIFTAKTFSVERPDPIPQKFRVAVPLQSSQEIVAGEAELPFLSEGEISRSEEQRNKFLKRLSATSRDQTVLPQTLLQKSTDNDRQEVTITETLQLGDTNEVPTATKTVSSEALGDGNYVVTKTEVPEVFAGEAYRKTKEDLTPQKFRAAQEDLTFEQSVAGTANPNLVLGTGEFAKSEQQVNKFVKRVSTTSRVITEAVVLQEKVLTPDGAIGNRVLTLASGDQSFVPSALLVDASVEALGDGRTVKTETTIPTIFTGQAISIERPDIVPERFRSATPIQSFEESVIGSVSVPFLSAGQFSKSEQQVTRFIKRVRTVGRDVSASKTIKNLQFTSDLGGGYAETTETYPFQGTDPVSPDLGTLEDAVNDLGDGTKIRRKTVLKKTGSGNGVLTELSGQEYDDALDLVIPFKQLVTDVEVAAGPRRRVAPRDIKHSVVTEYNLDDIEGSLDEQYWEVPDMVSISLPDKLKSVSVVWSGSKSRGTSDSAGDTFYVTKKSSSSSRAQIIYDIEQGFNGLIPAIRSIFFLPKNNASPNTVLNKLFTKPVGPTGFIPNPRPESRVVVAFGGDFEETETNSASFDSSSTSVSKTFGKSAASIIIPPTIHGPTPVTRILGSGDDTILAESGSFSFPSTIPATSPFTQFPVGRFLYQINSTPYRFGYVRIEAIVVDIKEEYV